MHTATPDLHGSPIQILNGGGFTAPPRRDTPPHRHTAWELVYYRRGRPRFVVDGVATQAAPGVVWLTPPGHVHAELAGNGFTNWFIGIDAPPDHPWPTQAQDDATGTFERLCVAIVGELAGTGSDREAMLALLAGELDLRLRRSAARATADPGLALVAEAEALFDQGSEDPLRLTTLARRLGVAASTLRLAFKQHRGEPPAIALRRRRIRRAVDLLTRTDLTLEAIADQCGFDSASHLSRWIRREHGCTPGSLRRTLPFRADQS